MLTILLIGLFQATSTPTSPAPSLPVTAPAAPKRTPISDKAVRPLPEKWSILLPSIVDCPKSTNKNEIIVCSTGDAAQNRLPLPDDRGPADHPVASNPELSAARALSLAGTPCAASQWGCPSAFGPPIAPIAKAAVGLVKSALAKKPNKRGRVPIDLDGPVGTVN